MLPDAQVLLAQGGAANAYYLAGYAVEMALKAIIARRFVAEDVPDKKIVADIHSHDLAKLLRLAQLDQALRDGSESLRANWLTVELWSEHSRYVFSSRDGAEVLIEAIRHSRRE